MSHPELQAKQARLNHLRAERAALRKAANPNLSPEEKARRSYEASLRKRIAAYQDQMARGEFEPPSRKEPRKLSDSELQLKKDLEDAKHDYFERVAEYRRANLSPIGKAVDFARETAHFSRALMTSFDLSAVLRQGGLAVYSHPNLARKAAGQMWSSLWSRQNEFNSMDNLKRRPNGQLYETSGLDITSDSDKLTRQEEAFMGRWARNGIEFGDKKVKIPGIEASARAYTTFLNNLRADLFDQMVENLGRNGQVSLDEAKVIARYINVATGRSDWKWLKPAAANLNTVFFAPRYVASRFQYMTMLASPGFWRSTPRVRRAIATEYARTFTGLASFISMMVALGSLAPDDEEEKPTVEMDPRSSDFMKIRFGDTRLDPMAGLSQAIVLSSRIISQGRKSTTTGEIRPFGEGHHKDTTASVLLTFARTKLAPVPGAAWTWADDMTNVVGQKETPLSLGASLFIPLSAREVVETMKQRGLAQGTALATLGILGMGLQTYGPKTNYMEASETERAKQLKGFRKTMDWNSEMPAYSEFLTQEQLDQLHTRRAEKQAAVVYDAASPQPQRKNYKSSDTYEEGLERHKKDLEEFQEFRRTMAPTYGDALRHLYDYYRDKGGIYEKGSLNLKPSFEQRRLNLIRLYNAPAPEDQSRVRRIGDRVAANSLGFSAV